MTIGILAAGLGLLLAAAAIVIPRVVNRRNDPEYDADSRAYEKETGRSARDIAQGNADQASQQENGSGSPQAGGSDGPADPPLSRGQDQVVAVGVQRGLVRDAVFGRPAEIGGSGVMCSAIYCEQGLN